MKEAFRSAAVMCMRRCGWLASYIEKRPLEACRGITGPAGPESDTATHLRVP